MIEARSPPNQHQTDAASLISLTRDLSLSEPEVMEGSPTHQELHQYFQRDYLLTHTFYGELPAQYQRPLTRDHRLPLYCLGIPFLDEEDLYRCAKSLPWKKLDRLQDMNFRPGHLERSPENCANAITSFFIAALGSRHCFHMYLKYCFVALDGTDEPLQKIPVVVYQDTHHVGSLSSAEILRSTVRAVLESYLFRDNIWARRGTFWMLGWDAVFDEDGSPLEDDMCPLVEFHEAFGVD